MPNYSLDGKTMPNYSLYRTKNAPHYYYQSGKKEKVSIPDIKVLGLQLQESEAYFKAAILTSKESNLTYSYQENGKWINDVPPTEEEFIYLYQLNKEKYPILFKTIPPILKKFLEEKGQQFWINAYYSEDAMKPLPSEIRATALESILIKDIQEQKLKDFSFEFPSDSQGGGKGKGSYSQKESERLNDRLEFIKSQEWQKVADAFATGLMTEDNSQTPNQYYQWFLELILDHKSH